MIYWYFGADINIVVKIKPRLTQFQISPHSDVSIIFPSVCRKVNLVLELCWPLVIGVCNVGFPLLDLTFGKVAPFHLTFQKHDIAEWYNVFILTCCNTKSQRNILKVSGVLQRTTLLRDFIYYSKCWWNLNLMMVLFIHPVPLFVPTSPPTWIITWLAYWTLVVMGTIIKMWTPQGSVCLPSLLWLLNQSSCFG